MDLFEWIEISKNLDCDGLEIYYRFLKCLKSDYLKRVRRKVEELNMTIPMICYSSDFTNPERGIRKKEIKKQIDFIKITSELGGSYCRILSGQGRPGVSDELATKWVIDCIESCLGAAEDNDICLVLENHYKDSYWKFKEFAQKKDIFLGIVNRIDSQYFGVQYDPSNAIVAGEDPIDLLDEVLDRVKTMHASDRYLRPGFSLDDIIKADGDPGYSKGLVHGVVGEGLNDYDAIFSRLSGVKFNGWISIEDGMNGFHEMEKSVKFLKKMRDKYFAGNV
ncbi:MAG: sugar phosphate isomerase/epimerase [Actinomycetota bacterium]|nr:sugar phosphate isomerase/epimerase [Actinomycetota bacterium]